MQRSIFILPASAPFVNATRVQSVQALPERPASPEAQRSGSAIAGPRTLDAEGLAEKTALVYSSCLIFSGIPVQALRQANSRCSIHIDNTMH